MSFVSLSLAPQGTIMTESLAKRYRRTMEQIERLKSLPMKFLRVLLLAFIAVLLTASLLCPPWSHTFSGPACLQPRSPLDMLLSSPHQKPKRILNTRESRLIGRGSDY